MTELQLGQRVRFTTHLERRSTRSHDGKNGPGKLWSSEPYPGHHLHGGEGIIIGKRTLADGHRHYEEYGYEFTPTRHYQAWLVAFDLHRKPVHVLPEHITPLEES